MNANATGMYNDAALRPNLYQSGFDPRQFLRLNTNEEGRREWSLDTAFKKLWFRTIYPNGRICTTVLEKDERHICINARVYADRMDPPDSYLAEGKAERFAPGDPASAKPYELYFADWAETVAIGRALTNAGFDVPFVNVLQDGLLLDPFTGEVLEENGGPAAAPAPAPQPAAQAAPPRQYSNVTAPPAQIPAQQTAPIQAAAPVPQAPVQRQQPPQKLGMTAPQQTGTPAATQPLQEPRNAEEAMQMPLEWAKNYRITVGIHTGKTLSEVAMIAPGALDWYLKKYSGNDFKLRAAAQILMDHAMAQAG